MVPVLRSEDCSIDSEPGMKPGVYGSFMSAGEQDRVPEAYYDRWERTMNVKLHHDPNNLFRLNQNIPTQGLAGERLLAV